jgi:hypothetical protein
VCITWHALLSAMVLRVKGGQPLRAEDVRALIDGGCPLEDVRLAFRDAGLDASIAVELDLILSEVRGAAS